MEWCMSYQYAYTDQKNGVRESAMGLTTSFFNILQSLMTFRAPVTFICRASLLRRRERKGRGRVRVRVRGRDEEGEKGDRRRRGRRRRGRKGRGKEEEEGKGAEEEEEEEEEGVEAETFRCIFCDISCPGTKTSSILAAVQAKFNNNAIYKLHTPYSLIHSHYLYAHPHSSKV